MEFIQRSEMYNPTGYKAKRPCFSFFCRIVVFHPNLYLIQQTFCSKEHLSPVYCRMIIYSWNVLLFLHIKIICQKTILLVSIIEPVLQGIDGILVGIKKILGKFWNFVLLPIYYLFCTCRSFDFIHNIILKSS